MQKHARMHAKVFSVSVPCRGLILIKSVQCRHSRTGGYRTLLRLLARDKHRRYIIGDMIQDVHA